MNARLTVAALAAAMTLTAPAWAQSKKELATRVVQLQQADYESIGRGVAGQTAQQVLQAVAPFMAQVPPEKREATGKDLQAEVKKFHDGIAPQLAERASKLAQTVVPPMLEEKFSEDELKQVIAFLESSASKKYRELGAVLPNTLAEKLIADTRSSIEPKLKTLEQTLQKKLAAAAGNAAGAAAPAKPASAPTKK